MISSLDRFPKDILWLLMSRYFSPCDAVRCLMVCKRFGQCIDGDAVRRRAIRTLSFSEHAPLFRHPMTTCELCNCILAEANVSTHMMKHEYAKDDPLRFRVQPKKLKQCELCEWPFPDKSHSGVRGWCPLEITTCDSQHHIPNFVTKLCHFVGYRYQVRRHQLQGCEYRCTMCTEMFTGSIYDHVSRHTVSSQTTLTLSLKFILGAGFIGSLWWVGVYFNYYVARLHVV